MTNMMKTNARTPLFRALRVFHVGTIALAGCVTPDVDDAVTERDSLGISIIESFAPEWSGAEGWTVSPESQLVAANDGGGDPLFRVQDAIGLSHRSIAIAHEGAHQIDVFGWTGGHQATFGGEGEGPGEFLRLNSISRYRGDSISVFDSRQRRITVFTASGSFGRTITLRTGPGDPIDVRAFPDGLFLLRMTARDVMDGPKGLVRIPEVLVLLTPSGEISDTVGAYAGYETFVGEFGDSRPPFARNGYMSLGDGRVAFGDANGVEYRITDLSRGIHQIIRVPNFPLTVSPAERSAVEEGIRSRRVPPAFADLPRQLLGAIPEFKPGYDALLMDEEGCVWLRAYSSPDRETPHRVWLVFDPAGRWLGEIDIPAQFQPYEIGFDYLLGRWVSELGEESVRTLALHRGKPEQT